MYRAYYNLTNSFVNVTFANTGELEEDIYPATVSEIASEQRKVKKLKRYFNKHVEVDPNDRISCMVINETDILLYDRQRLVIPTSMQNQHSCLVSSLLNAPWSYTTRRDYSRVHVLEIIKIRCT